MNELSITHFLNCEFVYIFLLCLIASLFISIFIEQKTIKKTAVVLFAVFFVLFSFELILSFFIDTVKSDYKPDFYSHKHDNELSIHSEIKIKSKIDGTTKIIETNEYDFEVYEKVYDVIYSYCNGLRYVKGNKTSTDTYLFFGCSFTHGDGLNDYETLPYFFSELYNFEKNILNLSFRGKSTNTVINILNNGTVTQFLNESSDIKHCFYSLIQDHIYRNFRILCNAPSDCYILENQRYIVVQPIVKFKALFARCYIFRKIFLPIIDEGFKLYYEKCLIQSLEEINKCIEEKYNSKLTIIVWPEFDNNFINRLKQTNLDLILLPKDFDGKEYKIKDDGHPTAKANEEIAQILYNHINEINISDKENINGKDNNS